MQGIAGKRQQNSCAGITAGRTPLSSAEHLIARCSATAVAKDGCVQVAETAQLAPPFPAQLAVELPGELPVQLPVPRSSLLDTKDHICVEQIQLRTVFETAGLKSAQCVRERRRESSKLRTNVRSFSLKKSLWRSRNYSKTKPRRPDRCRRPLASLTLVSQPCFALLSSEPRKAA